MNKLVIIGNGFDLAHGLKTRYEDFLLWEINEAFKQPCRVNSSSYRIESPLFTVESNYNLVQNSNLEFIEFESIDDFLRYLADKKDGRVNKRITYTYPFIEKLIEFSSKNWVDIEREYYRHLVNLQASTAYDNKQKLDVLKKLNASMDLIKKRLEIYLSEKKISEFETNKEITQYLSKIIQMNNDYGSTLVLNFNYTDTIEKYIINTNVRSIYIHGRLKKPDSPKNPIIFGYGDESDDYYEKIEKLNQNEYLKHMKSFAYLQSSNYKNLFKFLDEKNIKFDVFIMGHSCGLSDRLLFTHIFEHPNFNSVKIYYYDKPDRTNDFFERTQEISRYFRLDAKHKMRKVLVPFNESVRLVKYEPKE